jgi:Ser/Thr protein kinase RdoA (MazF antagonist)
MSKLNTEHLFVPSQENVSAILARYNLPLIRFVPAAHGIENITLLVWSQKNRYVLRIYPQGRKSNEEILLELDFMSYLRNNGLPVPAIISSSDQESLLVVYTLDHQKWQCTLAEYASGTHPEALTPALLDHMALLQARMHMLGEQYANTLHMKSVRDILKTTDLPDELLEHIDQESPLQDMLKRIKAYVVKLDHSLPEGLSHFDFDIENVLTSGDQVTAILDFGDLECLPLVVCLGYTLWDVLFEKGGSQAMVTRYLQTYQTVRQLNQKEKAVLREIMLFRHYIITTVRVQFGNFSQDDLKQALQQEQELKNLELRF